MAINIWSTGISSENAKIFLTRRSAVRDFLFTLLDEACDKTGHSICGTAAWTHKIPLSLKKDEWEGEKYWSNTLGMWLYNRYNDAVIWLTDKDEQVASLEITPEQLKQIAPDLAEILEEAVEEREKFTE
jgi:hypothetical protein